jgi:catalase
VHSLKAAAKKANADFVVVAPKVGGAAGSDGKVIEADMQLAGAASVLFDAVYVAVSDQGAKTLSKEAAAVGWVHDAFAHCKVIGATAAAKPLLDAAGVVADAGVLVGGDANAFVSTAANGRIWDREPKVKTTY